MTSARFEITIFGICSKTIIQYHIALFLFTTKSFPLIQISCCAWAIYELGIRMLFEGCLYCMAVLIIPVSNTCAQFFSLDSFIIIITIMNHHIKMTTTRAMQSFTKIVTSHLTSLRKLSKWIYYCYLHVEENFIIDHAFFIATSYVSLVHKRSRLIEKATYKLKKAAKFMKTLKKKKSTQREMGRRRKRAALIDHAHCGIPLPTSVWDITPQIAVFLVAKLSVYSILAIPLFQISLIAFAPFWIMLCLFLIPPFLISYCIITVVYTIVTSFYLEADNLDERGYVNENGLENNNIIS
jgi:hypothetical protein